MRFAKSEDHEESGEVLLVFLDSSHCQVTLRVKREALAALVSRIQSEPDPPLPIG